jgi:hypothetical protein
MDKFIRLGEHIFELPKAPAKKDILFADLKPKDQYWRRFEVPPLFLKFKAGITEEFSDKTMLSENGNYLESLSYEDTEAMLKWRADDFQRRWNGVWFMNNGEPTWLSPGQYFQLQWGAMPDYNNPYTDLPYGEYREFHRDTHYMLHLCKFDKHCGGLDIGKPKKTGITNLLAIDYVDESTKYREKMFGMMSKSEKDCKDSGFKYYCYCFDRLPDAIKPEISNRTLSSFHFGAPKIKNTGTSQSAKKMADRKEGLDSQIYVAATKADAFDGPKMFRAWTDEFSKLEDPYPDMMFKKAKETVKLGHRIVGKYWLSAYTPENDATSFKESRQVWYDSELDTKNGGDRTLTGIYNFFISAENSFEEDEYTFDIYGKNNTQRARKLILDTRNTLKNNPSELQAYIRQYPIVPRDMWQIGGAGGATFNNVRLGNQLDYINDKLKTGQLPWEMGNLVWKDRTMRLGRGYGQGIFGEVQWVPLTQEELISGKTAPFTWVGREYMDPDSFNVPVRKRIKDKKGNYRPDEISPYCQGIDPTEFIMKSLVGEGSHDAMIVSVLPDIRLNASLGKSVTDRPMVMYFHRHDNPDDFYEDAVKSILFFGAPTYAEGNKKWLTKKLIDDKLHNFLAMRSAEKFIEMYDERKKQTTLDTVKAGSVNTVTDIVVTLKRYMRAPVAENEYDNMQLIMLPKLIEQLMSFDTTDTKKSDLVMAFGFCEMLKESIMGMRVRNDPNRGAISPKKMAQMFQELAQTAVPYRSLRESQKSIDDKRYFGRG